MFNYSLECSLAVLKAPTVILNALVVFLMLISCLENSVTAQEAYLLEYTAQQPWNLIFIFECFDWPPIDQNAYQLGTLTQLRLWMLQLQLGEFHLAAWTRDYIVAMSAAPNSKGEGTRTPQAPRSKSWGLEARSLRSQDWEFEEEHNATSELWAPRTEIRDKL